MSQNPTEHCVLALILATFALPTHAANLLLREVSTHKDSVVYLGDVADVSAASATEMEDLLTTPLMAAPAPGTQHFLQARQIRDLLARRGLDVTTLTIAGARTVEVGQASEPVAAQPTEPIPAPTAAQSEEAVIAAIEQHLLRSTGHAEWEIELQLNPALAKDLAKLGLNLEAIAGRAPWTGTQRFQIKAAGLATTVPIVARVDRLKNVVVAIKKIERGALIGAADVEISLQGGNAPTTVFFSLDDVIGKEAVREIDANAVLQASQLRAPLQVQRGETVKVFARTGGIQVSTFAIVQQDGALGDLVQVQTVDKKDRFAAQVVGWKQLEVLPTGATAVDYSTANRLKTQTR